MNIKQDLKQYALLSPHHITKTDSKSGALAKYSGKFRKNGDRSGDVGWDIMWDYFPMELKIGEKRKKLKRSGKNKFLPTVPNRGKKGVKRSSASRDIPGALDDNPPRAKKRRKVTFDEGKDGEGLVKKLDTLEKAEQSSAESEQSGEEENAEEVYDEYEDEEGTDYNLTYFDNGEEYDVGDDEALEEGPVY